MKLFLFITTLLVSFNSFAVDNLNLVCSGKISSIYTNDNNEVIKKETKSFEIKDNKLIGDFVTCDCVDMSNNKIVCNGRVGVYLRSVEIDRLSATVKEVKVSQYPTFTKTEEFNGACKTAKRQF